MASARSIRWAKVAVWAACLAPLASLGWKAVHQDLGANPIEYITHATGDWTIRFLVLTLAERSIRPVADIPFATEVDAGAVGTVLPYPERSVVLRFDPREITTPELIARASQVYEVDELSIHTPDLDDVFLALTGRPDADRQLDFERTSAA